APAGAVDGGSGGTMDVRVRMTALLLLMPAAALAQSPKAATYITDEQVKAVNALPGIDRQLVSVDIGKLNLAVGVIHRGATTASAAAAPRAAGAPTSAAPSPAEACGEPGGAPPAAGAAPGILHDGQTETYVIISGGGTL